MSVRHTALYVPAGGGGGTTESIPNGTLSLTPGTPLVSQTAPGQVKEQIPFGALSLSANAPLVVKRIIEPVSNGSLILTTTPPALRIIIRGSLPSNTLTLTTNSSLVRKRTIKRPQTGQITLTGGTPTIRQSGKFSVLIPSGTLRLSTFAPNLPSRVAEQVKAGGGPKPSRGKVVIIGGRRYKIESYTQLRRILEQYLHQQQQELQQVEAVQPKSRKAIRLRKTVTRTETRLAKADIEYRQMIEQENEAILLMALGE